MNLAFIDFETTGLSFDSEIIEVAVVSADRTDLKVLEEWSVKVKPKNLAKADPVSLKIVGFNNDEWADAIEIKSALEIFLEKTKNKILVGHNLIMDWMWLSKALAENGLRTDFTYQSGQFHYFGLDTISLAYAKLGHVLSIEQYSLGGLAQYFGINQATKHRALDDARTTYELFVKLLNY